MTPTDAAVAPYRAAWEQSWRDCGATSPDPGLLPALVARYAEPHRHYHSLQHLGECLVHWQRMRDEATHGAEVALALWFHDAVYDIPGPHNEQRSADWARTVLVEAGAPEAAERVHALVMVTRHDVLPHSQDARILLDIDLSILGAPVPRFDEYERQVRAEHAIVSDDAFRRRRRGILQQFLDRPRIYHTQRFLSSHEQQARDNLARSIARLQAGEAG